MAHEVVICTLGELPDGDARAFTADGQDGPIEGFLVRRGSEIVAYRNRCPHQGTPLDWMPGRFLSVDGTHIVCATHGARFRIGDGFCFAGPCRGASLTALLIAIRNGLVVLSR